MSAQVNPFFTPTQISGCRLWLDAADLTSLSLSGRTVAVWRDKSGIGNDYSQATSANQPLYTIDPVYNRPCLSFNGSGTILNQTNTSQFPISNTNTFSIFTAHRINSGSGIYTVYRGVLVSTRYWFRWQSTFANFITDRDPEGYINFASGNISAMNGISAFMNDTTTAEGFINGTSVGSASKTATTINQYFTIGASASSGGEVLLGSIFEILIYNSLLTPTQRQQIEGYLAWKWGLQSSLPATHPYRQSIIPPLLNPPTTPASLVQNSQSTFSPTQIPGCQLWLDGADPNGTRVLPTNGASVITWTDKSGQGYNTSNLTGTPTFSSNAIVFTGTQAMGTNLGFAATLSNSSMFCVTSYTSAFNGAFIETNVTLGNNGSGIDFFVTGGQQRVNGWATGLILNGATGLSINTRNLHGLTLATGTTGSAYLYLDGAQSGSNTSLNFTYTSGGLFALGNWKNGGSYGTFFTGTINEVVVYSSILTTQQRQQVEGYLAWKWGLQGSLPASHPFRLAPPFVPASAFPARSLAQTAGFNPLRISGCSCWLDASDLTSITASGSTVSQWRDKALSRAFNGSGTVASANSFACVRFNGSQGMTSATTFSFAEVCTNAANMICFMVVNVSSLTGVNSSPFALNVAQPRFIPFYNTSGTVFFDAGNQANPRLFGSFTNNVRQLHVFLRTGITTLQIRINGSQNASNTFVSPANFGNQSYTGFLSPSGAGGTYVGDIHEIVYYSNEIGLTNLQQVEGYLAWKWGLQGSLPATHPWKQYPPPPS